MLPHDNTCDCAGYTFAFFAACACNDDFIIHCTGAASRRCIGSSSRVFDRFCHGIFTCALVPLIRQRNALCSRSCHSQRLQRAAWFAEMPVITQICRDRRRRVNFLFASYKFEFVTALQVILSGHNRRSGGGVNARDRAEIQC